MKLASLIKEEKDIYDILKSKRHDINVEFGPRTYSMLQRQIMLDNEGYVKDWLEKNAFIEQPDDFPPKDKALEAIRNYVKENLRNWFKKEKWKRIDTQGNIKGDCGTMPKGKKTQRCLPAAKARSLTKKQRAATSRKKTRSKKQFVKNTKAAKVSKK